jgi:hypothetical protein
MLHDIGQNERRLKERRVIEYRFTIVLEITEKTLSH